ncbi:MAG: hypothetical protein JW995_07260 [Melioribacteraceae bacterium]|nr:hypothetical protein [Melioribacteraceae bacterium]
MKKIKSLIIVFLLFLSSYINAQDYGVALRVSTLGVAVEGMRSFGTTMNARIGFAMFSISQNGGGGTEDYTYVADADLSSIAMLTDWFPFGQTFRITAGLLMNLNKAEINLVPTKTYTIGGDIYTPEKLGTMTAKVDFNKFAPYIGVGIGNPLSGDSGFKFTFDLGTMYQGTPNIGLSATGLISPSAAPDQEQTLENNLKWFKWYPIVSLGLTYKF